MFVSVSIRLDLLCSCFYFLSVVLKSEMSLATQLAHTLAVWSDPGGVMVITASVC